MQTISYIPRCPQSVRIVLLCCAFLLACGVAFLAFNREMSLVSDRLEVINRLTIESIRVSLQQGNMKEVEQKIQAMLETYALEGIELHNSDGSTLITTGSKQKQLMQSLTYGERVSWQWPVTLLFQYSDAIFHNDKPLGFLITYMVADSSIFLWPASILFAGLLLQYSAWKLLLIRLLTVGNGKKRESKNTSVQSDTAESVRDNRISHDQNEELRRERDIAVANAEAKNRFIANMSHEVRSSLNGVIGVLALLKRAKLDANRMRMVRAASRSADSLLLIINDVLDFAKIESGRIEFEKIPFDLRETVEESITLFIDSARAKGLRLHCYIPTDIASQVIGDPTRLRQILTNLLSNAVKFTNKGEVNLLLTTMEREDGRQRLRFTVEDTGIGIQQAKLDTIFEMFAQADISTTRNYGGSGVGLSICKELVEQQDGEIGVQSSFGKGASFWFSLDFEIAGENFSRLFWPQLAQKEILLFDNCETCSTIINQYLKNAVVTTRRIESSDDVVNQLIRLKVDGQNPEIMLIDHESIDSETEAVLEKISSICGKAAPRIFVLTWESGEAQERIKRGAAKIIHKPVFLFQLCDMLSGISPELPTVSKKNDNMRGSVLLVDDEEINRHVGEEILKKIGCIVDVAESGSEALEKTAKNAYDLVLMDVQMPLLSGIETAEMIRKREKETGEQHLGIVALTANGLKTTRESCLAAGMDGFIVKPIHPDLLRKELAQWLNREDSLVTDEMEFALEFSADKQTSNNPGSKIHWNRQLALQYLGGDEQLLAELMRMFLKKKDRLLAAIEDAMVSQNAEEISSAAHAFKGAVNHFAAGKCRQLAQTIETRASTESLEGLDMFFKALLNATAALEKELEKEI